MNEYVFCKIVSGKMQSMKVFEDKWSIAFMDIAKDVDGYIVVGPKNI